MNPIGADLFEEKSLWAIYRKSVARLSKSRFNIVTTIVLFAILSTYAILSPNPYNSFVELNRSIGDLGIGFGSQILGFLIGGFTIFATLAKPGLFVLMYQKTHPASKLNYLKHNFFAFVEVFAVYLFLLTFCLLIKLLGSPNGVVSYFLQFVTRQSCISLEDLKSIVAKFTFVMVGTLMYYSLLSLKSFIFNIYHVVITSIVSELNSSKK